ncbi:emopamil binding protein [Colletotrichum scovillei]|uniref:Emopamil binding protein n=2 Tax=Colletotrichum acutatum species complex TaxID=2707335 RepID=A0A010SAV6_9PEZI|nr:emopamil binding protein [Colletotrichum scovillei]EXF81873.1 emopamil binding protein [Colletotrichum fioriniae PJ7]KAF4779774.1 emopamil binding protein [Colletotrichum scovillei]KAG7057961.1 emopamil binding protein [Colletotrichum scovillei]KAG7076558.1 emopamil binding protein [Colletotrichum scovillei]KAG7083701.1 emopamil binding protein [Colletotrichum scovillei]
MSNTSSSLPPDLFDQTTLISLAATVVLLSVAIAVSRRVLHPATSTSYRVLFIWHAFDALIHFFLEGSFLYHCFFSYIPLADVPDADLSGFHPTPANFLGHSDRIYGAQAGGNNPFAQLWMVYARADKRWAGADLGVISLELLTVFGAGPLAVWICYSIAKRDPKVNIWMIVIATAELYGGFMTFCPEWLTGNIYLDTSNFMYLWVYLVFFNMLWVFIPIYAIYVAYGEISAAFKAQGVRKNL